MAGLAALLELGGPPGLAALPGFAEPGGLPDVVGGLAVLELGLGLAPGTLPVFEPGGPRGLAPPGLAVLEPGVVGLELGLGVLPCDDCGP